ncbi:thiol reductant ABC exporter subunit CydC [Alkalihalophilus lindianensis]|uniref:Thiol reductant ABC exporter subunit CydC n=1 Tax=Alkalihalophilus lindianensis TaxID=1630542 RepID=A0ABU3X6V7_9BACI|nr:thiol reductant ABC exporter subunit CydC [Alkalihalophilus lindianensis]MDV2683636.1 thiol reductant ABC exporter subunit CydC [Alkalihalophilus lindianensis]
MKDLTTIIKLMTTEKKDIVYSVVLGFLAGLAAIGLFSASGYLISKAALTPPLYALTILIALLKLFSITRAVARYGERYFSHRATFTMLSDLRVSFYEKLEPLAPNLFQRYRSGDLLSRIVGDVESLQNFFLRVFYPPIVLALVFLATIVFTMFYSIYISLLLLLGLLLTAIVIPACFAASQKKKKLSTRTSRGALSTETTELLYGYRDLKIYGQLEDKKSELIDSSTEYVVEQQKEGQLAMANQSIHTMISLFISWGVLALGAYLVSTGQLDGLFLAMLMMISLTAFENAAPMAVFPNHFEDSRNAAKRLYSVVDTNPKEFVERVNDLSLGGAKLISLTNVSFSFANEERPTLNDVTVQFPKGSKTAVVGASGSGKSTLMQLLLNIQEADSGEIKIDNHPIDELNQESIWEHANVVLQENHFFYGTIKENLLLANPDRTEEEMMDALKKVDLDGFFLTDEVYEKGENLSGGEKQRLAIARAMLKGGSLWLLDEPTSSVDSLTEKKIYDHLLDQAKQDTMIIISHRLMGLEKMDQIIVMEKGLIIETGTFNELINSKGYFYEMKQLEKNLLI